MATWNKIRTLEEYQTAHQRLDELIDAEHTEATHNELMLLSFLIDDFESVQYPIKGASPLRVLKFMMEMKGIRQKDLIPILGSKSQISKILNGSANIRLEMVGPLSKLLGIPKEALIPDVAVEDDPIGVIAEYADLPFPKDTDSKLGIPWDEKDRPWAVAYEPDTKMDKKPREKVKS